MLAYKSEAKNDLIIIVVDDDVLLVDNVTLLPEWHEVHPPIAVTLTYSPASHVIGRDGQ
jgi:hypothetical protein